MEIDVSWENCGVEVKNSEKVVLVQLCESRKLNPNTSGRKGQPTRCRSQEEEDAASTEYGVLLPL